MSCRVMQPAVMDGLPTGGRLGMEDMTRELARKRKALDKEIERFMALKDAEYRKFEKDLRAQLEQSITERPSSQGKASPTIVARGFSVPSPLLSPWKLEADKNVQSSQNTPVSGQPDRVAFSKRPIGTRMPLEQTSSSVVHVSELAALSPTTSPATDDHTYEQNNEQADDQTVQVEPPVNDRRLSTSLITQSKTSDNERPEMVDRRSSSSPTGTGRSARRKSSLKSPDSSRGRKHVLFSIDNQVMSPSSSPVTTRTIQIRNPPIPFSGLRDLIVDGTMEQAPDVVPVSHQPLMLPATSFSKSYKDLVEPTVTTPPEVLMKEEIQLGVKDPLFDTDEPPPPIIDEEWELSPVETKSEDEEEIISASPHVGSLPIQIRMPARR